MSSEFDEEISINIADQIGIALLDVDDMLDADHTAWPGKRKSTVKEVSSLQDIALECISKEFRRFVQAYTVSEDPVLQRNLEFLRRRYSFHFISNKLEEGVLDPEYFDFLLNEHLKELNFVIFSLQDLDRVLECLSRTGHGILNTSFCGTVMNNPSEEETVSSFISKVVCYLTNVTVLDIGWLCTDKTLENISNHCLELKELNIDGSKVTHSGLSLFSKSVPMLKSISLNGILLDEIPFDLLLKNLPCLEALHHPQLAIMIYAMHKNDFKNNSLQLKDKYNLTTLSFNERDLVYKLENCLLLKDLTSSQPNAGDILFVCAELCPKITTLKVENTSEFDFMLISRFQNLECLTLVNRSCTFQISNLNKLLTSDIKFKRLSIDGFSVSALVLIQGCPSLEYLYINHIVFESMDQDTGDMQFNLKELVFTGLTFYEPHVEESVNFILQCSSKLEKLSFADCECDDSEIISKLTRFCEKSTLQHITFTRTDVEESVLQTIMLTCPSIKTITLEYCDSISYDHVYNLNKVAESLPNFVEIIWNDDRSEENSWDLPMDDLFDYDASNYDSYSSESCHDSDYVDF